MICRPRRLVAVDKGKPCPGSEQHTASDQIPCFSLLFPCSSECQEQASLLCWQTVQVHEGMTSDLFMSTLFPKPSGTDVRHPPNEDLRLLFPRFAVYQHLPPAQRQPFSIKGDFCALPPPWDICDSQTNFWLPNLKRVLLLASGGSDQGC